MKSVTAVYIYVGPDLYIEVHLWYQFCFIYMIFQSAPPSHISDEPIANNASTGVSFSPRHSVAIPLPAWGAVFLLGPTSHPPQRFLQGSSPLSQSDLTACPGTPCRRSAQQHTGLSDGPPGRGPSTPLWRRTPSGCLCG